jgi:DNA-binding response OmpR family regulator
MTHQQSILLIDDDPELRSVLTDGLTYAGYNVTPAAGGIEGLELAKDEHFDTVITDILMEDGEGMETLGWITKQCPGTPVIAISGQSEYLNKIKLLGATATLQKPFSIHELINVIGEITGD